MTARRKYRTANFKTPPLDLRPRPPSAKGWELYHPLGHYPPIPDTDGFQRASAYHEAGHCIGYVEFDIPFTRAWMEHPKTGKARVSGRRAHTRFKDNSTIRDAVWRQYHEAQAILSMSGPEAEARYAPAAYILIGAGYEGEIHGRPVFLPDSDLCHFHRHICALGYPYRTEQHDAAARELGERTRLLIKELWPDVQTVARALYERGSLSEADVRELMHRPPRNKDRYRARRRLIDCAEREIASYQS